MEGDYIGRKAVLHALMHLEIVMPVEEKEAYRAARRAISLLPAADVAPVVRCAKCRKRATRECPLYENSDEISGCDWAQDDGFCSLGARMDLTKEDAK